MNGKSEVFTAAHGSHMLLVKNTFLDIDVWPEPEQIVRAYTAPPLSSKDDDDADDSSDSSSEGNDATDISLDNQQAAKRRIKWADTPPGEDLDEEDVPEMLDVARLRTATISYESHADWSWAAESMLVPAQPSEQFVMYPVMCPQVVSMVPVMMAPISGGSSEGIVPHCCVPASLGFSEHAGVDVASLASDLVTGTEPSSTSLPIPQALTAAQSVSSSCFRVQWNADARKLTGNDKRAVSPQFELFLSPEFPNVPCRILLQPKVVNDGKGGACFRKSKGRGIVQLKCEQKLAERVPEIAIRISVGDGTTRQQPRGAIRHSFSSSAICGLPKDQDEWNFQSAVDKGLGTFAVCLEIIA